MDRKKGIDYGNVISEKYKCVRPFDLFLMLSFNYIFLCI